MHELNNTVFHSCCHGGMSGCRSTLQCSATVCTDEIESFNETIQLPGCETIRGTLTPTHGANINQTESILIHEKTPSITLSRSPKITSKRTPKSTPRRRDRKGQPSSSSLTIIVLSVFGCLIVLLILALMPAVLILCIFQKRKHRQYGNKDNH